MKRIAFFAIFCGVLSFTSCGLFELDNYEAPGETIQGEVVDVATGDPVLTDQASAGIRVRLTETSWGENATHNPDFNCMPNGTFQNTKLFKGTYNIRIDGAFVPIYREDASGNVIYNETQNKDIKGTVKVKFEVQPFLKVEWVGAPTVVNGKVTAQVRVTRAVSVEDFQNAIEPMGGYDASFTNITDVQLFVGYSSTMGYSSRDTNWSNGITYTGGAFNALLGQTITLTSIGTIPLGRNVFVRAAARINYDTPKGSGTKRYNYNEVREVIVPSIE